MRHLVNTSPARALCASLFLTSSLIACGGGGQSPVVSDTPPVTGGPATPNDLTCSADGPITFPSSAAVPQRFTGTAPDADTTGPYGTTETIRYDFEDLLVADGDTNATYPAEVDGWIRYPIETDTAKKPANGWPVVLYLHGRHSTCEYAGGFESLSAECPDQGPGGTSLVGTSRVNSYQGYDYMAESLTSHGYAVISSDANDINDKDAAGDAGADARAALILHTLDEFRNIDAGNATSDDGDAADGNPSTDFTALVDSLDFERVGIMGHSRGGQGVGHVIRYNKNPGNRGAIGDFDAPQNLVAVFSLAPTDFDELTVTDTTFVTLLPYCDGDVSNLQGARTYDNSRYVADQTGTLLQVLTDGSNHNDYNTIWTSDDYSNDDAHCNRDTEGNGRLTREEVRRHGEFLMNSFFRLFVGGETQFQPYWEGKHHLPASACPLDENGNAITPCDTVARLSILAKPENRLVIDDLLDDTSLTTNNLMGSTTFEGFSSMSQCQPTTGGAGCPSAPTYSRAGQLAVSWDAPATYTTGFDELDVTEMDHFTMRAGVNEDAIRNANGQEIDIVLTDCGGRSATVHATDYSDALFLPPGNSDNTEGAKLTQNGIHIPLTAFQDIDLERLTKLELKFNKEATGDIQFTDLVFQNIGDDFSIPMPLTSP